MRIKKQTALWMSALFCLAAAPVAAQDNIDWDEDSTELVTVKDIIEKQQKVTMMHTSDKHFADVWGRRSYMNFGFSSSKLTPSERYATGLSAPADKIPAKYSSNWGASFQYGRSYRLHKRPIANMLQFNIDYTGIDLNFNHYEAESGNVLFDSSSPFYPDPNDTQSPYYHTPWNLEKYEANYAMALGPSVTVAPFTTTKSQQLHFMKFNIYFHVGYQASMLIMKGDMKKDNNPDTKSTRFKEMDDATLVDWSHGLISSVGFNVAWKAIGIGYEHRSGKMKYRSVRTSTFSSEKFEFDQSVNRVYIQYRM